MKLETEISEVCWCNPKTGYNFVAASLRLPSKGNQASPQTTAWLDELLDGGFTLPIHSPGKRQALGILITGPPGTGKSTLALELAYRWSGISKVPEALTKITGSERLQILYATLEATPEEMVHNAESYQWNGHSSNLQAIKELSEMQEGKVNIISLEKFQNLKDPEGHSMLDSLCNHIKEVAKIFRGNTTGAKTRPPDVVVIDSLNSIPKPDDRGKLFLQYSKLVESSPIVVILILDSSSVNQRAEFWEFASDVVIRLDRQYDASGYMGYMIRNIEILKARFQYHAWGKHQLKIYKGSTLGTEGMQSINPIEAAERMRSHPYRNEGGIFIFPSIHFILSGYKHILPPADRIEGYYPAKVPNLSELLGKGKGFPMGRCTALIGERGGHKSHLGYVELLHRLVSAPKAKSKDVEKALIVSLRDDEGMTRRTMTKILTLWNGTNQNKRLPDLPRLEKDGKLEITYFPPGYITPEEFFHRIRPAITQYSKG